jgi:glutaminyl-tRNA synthetase
MIRTRFPPEPNGYLHLGHVKAMLFDFEHHPGCDCTLRLDDTNPEMERQEFVDAILEDVAWMGFKPSRVTYTSDYFNTLYEFAERLIAEDKAYVDFSTSDEIKEGRLHGTDSVWRSKTVEWNLAEFRKMRDGMYKNGECTLRLKIDMKHENPNLRDPIAYRIKHAVHYRTGDTWKIYPSYDYSHGLIDSLEKITHSYCTSEFLIRRPQYLWPVEQLGLTAANVVEFGRLNVEGVSLSKRKIIPLVESGELDGFDDPRLFTIRGLRRRGFTPELLKELAGLSSINLRDTELSKSIVLHTLRSHYNTIAPRAFAVSDPLPVMLEDGTLHSYIDRSDFRDVDSPSYYRMAPGKTVRLRYGPCISYVSHTNDALVACISPDKKVKGIIHWTPPTAKKAIFESYEDIDIHSTKTIKHGLIHPDVTYGNGEVYQFERVGYYKYDRMEGDIPVFLKIVGLLNTFKE